MSAGKPDGGLPGTLIASILLAAALAPLGSTMIAVALPEIGQDLGTGDADLTQWLVASYLITSIALQSPGGKLGDLISHKRALFLGLGLVATGSTLGFALATLPALVAARVLMAAGGASIVPAAMAIMRNHIAADRRARAFGYFGAAMGLAAAVGPLLGGEVTALFGWRAIFAANLPVIAISLVLLLARADVLARDAVPGPHPRFDLLGSACLAIGITLPLIALRVPSSSGLWLGLAGGLLLAAFPFLERRRESPVIDFDLFRSRPFVAGGLIVGFQNLAMYALLFQFPIFVSQVLGEGADEVGRTLLAMTLTMVIASVGGGRLSEILGARTQVLLGSMMALSGLYWFLDWTRIQTAFDVAPGLILLGGGLGLSSAPSQAAAMAGARRDNSGMAAGVLSTLRYLGGVVGIALLGLLLNDPTSAASHRTPVLFYAGALVAAGLLALSLPGRHRTPGQPVPASAKALPLAETPAGAPATRINPA